MILLLLNVLGRLLAVTPEPLLRAFCVVAGELVLWAAPRRRRVLRSNLHHAFPDRPRAWRRGIARTCSRRMVETALLSLAAPFLSERRIREMGRLGASAEAFARSIHENPRPVVLATLHLALWETQTWLKLLSPVPIPDFGIIFRPLDNPSLDAFVKRTRERHGMKLLSRKAGFAQALSILRSRGCVGILVDQNAGDQGALTLFFGRVCSTTELPGVLASKFGAEVRVYYPKRTAFWRVTFECEPVPGDGTVEGTTLSLNRWIEGALSQEDLCGSWLWAHDRWRNQDVPARRLRLEAKRNFLGRDVSYRGLAHLPRGTRVFIRMPNWLGDVAMALPLLRALRSSRPDAQVTLLAKAGFAPLLEMLGVAARVIALPPQGPRYFGFFTALRAQYPDVWILFTNSLRGDMEAWLSGCPQRLGIRRPGKPRPLLSHSYHLPRDFDEAHHHQTELWGDFLRHFGLSNLPDCSPFRLAGQTASPPAPIGLIAGSENEPRKRWAPAGWRSLIEAFPDERFVLLGTAADAQITAQIAAGQDPLRVTDLAGKTSLLEFASALSACRLLVTNDTGGMHLANALGVPLVGLFGPTNPIRTGPIYSAPHRILQPQGCPPWGGASLGELGADPVARAVRDLL